MEELIKWEIHCNRWVSLLYFLICVMVIAAIKLTEEPRMDKYTEQDILLDFNPTKIVDTINMGSDLKRDGYWSDRFIIYLVTSPTNKADELKEMVYVYRIFQEACPDFLKVFWFKKSESFIVAYPFMKEEQDAQNFIDIKAELIRVIQFLLLRRYKREEVIKNIKEYKRMLVNISKEKGD
jgi:hypothetical protein